MRYQTSINEKQLDVLTAKIKKPRKHFYRDLIQEFLEHRDFCMALNKFEYVYPSRKGHIINIPLSDALIKKLSLIKQDDAVSMRIILYSAITFYLSKN